MNYVIDSVSLLGFVVVYLGLSTTMLLDGLSLAPWCSETVLLHIISDNTLVLW